MSEIEIDVDEIIKWTEFFSECFNKKFVDDMCNQLKCNDLAAAVNALEPSKKIEFCKKNAEYIYITSIDLANGMYLKNSTFHNKFDFILKFINELGYIKKAKIKIRLSNNCTKKITENMFLLSQIVFFSERADDFIKFREEQERIKRSEAAKKASATKLYRKQHAPKWIDKLELSFDKSDVPGRRLYVLAKLDSSDYIYNCEVTANKINFSINVSKQKYVYIECKQKPQIIFDVFKLSKNSLHEQVLRRFKTRLINDYFKDRIFTFILNS